MGKTADNERIKLRATFNNNIAVALYAGGFLIPYLAIFQKAPQMADFIISAVEARKISFSGNDLGYVVAIAAAFFTAMALAERRRQMADELLRKLTD